MEDQDNVQCEPAPQPDCAPSPDISYQRLRALELAISLHGHAADPIDVCATADMFLTFILGD